MIQSLSANRRAFINGGGARCLFITDVNNTAPRITRCVDSRAVSKLNIRAFNGDVAAAGVRIACIQCAADLNLAVIATV